MGVLSVLGSFLVAQPKPVAITDASIRYAVTQTQTAPRRKSKTGTSVSAGFLNIPDPTAEVRGDRWYGSNGYQGIASIMMNDPHVRQSVNYITAPLVSATWRFRPASKNPIDREIADFCDYAFVECLPWDQELKRIVQGYVVNGFDINEITYDNKTIPVGRFPQHPGSGVGVIPKSIHDVPASTIHKWKPVNGDASKLDGITQLITAGGLEETGYTELDAKNILRFTYDQTGGNFTGKAILRSAYQPWKLKITFINLDAIKHERYAVGFPVLTTPEEVTQEELETARALLAEMRSHEKGYAIFPDGYKFEWTGTTQSDGTNLNEAIERCNKDIAINVACGFMLLGLTGQSGSYALGSTQQGQYHLSVENHAKFVASVFNTGLDGWSIVERIVRLNYGDKVQVPRLEARNLPTKNWAEIAKVVFNGVQAGVITADDALEETIRDSMQLDPHEPETARRLPSVVDAQAKNKSTEDPVAA